MQPNATDYDVDADDMGVPIHTMSIHTLASLEAAFQLDICGTVVE